ncbi:hypothetical protein AK830_g7864 [Neonectria ditissima]|uniref:Major facilitator superfamily (MFS) profile domain-containing protein n=1 Tax=Neonectria ditissima TaxID=78410 RepID=A0A0P7BFD1_9HYPO|nr:hypothetical protein AK830_g7864 [Neonectria ditissima]
MLIIATTLGQPSFLSYFGLDTRSNAAALLGAINGLFQVGGLIGALSCTVTADSLGRRKAMALASLFGIIGGGLQAGSVNVGMFIAARFITGVGIGALVTLVPLYQSEIAPLRIRGLLVGMHGVMIGTGYALASWVGLGFFFVNASGAQWRIPLAIQCLPPLCLAAGVMMLPETPRWLLTKDRAVEAYAAYKMTRAETTDDIITNESAIREEFDHLHGQLIQQQREAISFLDLFKRPSMRKRCIIGFLTMFGAQATATIVINNYGPILYRSLGFNSLQQLLIASGWVSVAPFGNWINAAVVDRIGRVNMLVFGVVGCIVALIGECITVSIFQRTGARSAASAAVFFLFLHIGVFTLSIDATTYIYASEIFPTPVRAKGLAVSVSGLFLATIVFLMAAPTAFDQIGWKYYLLFISLTTVITIVAVFYFPETWQRSLEDMGELFGDAIDAVPLEGQKSETLSNLCQENEKSLDRGSGSTR